MYKACFMTDVEIGKWEEIVQHLWFFILYAVKWDDDDEVVEKVPIAKVVVPNSTLEFFQEFFHKNRIKGKTVYGAFVEFVVKHTKKEAPCIFLPLYPPFGDVGDGTWEFYVEVESVAVSKADEEEKKRLKYLPVVKLYEVIEKIF